MSHGSTKPPSRFRIRWRGYDRRLADAELAAIAAECAAAREKREEALTRIRSTAAELSAAYAKLREYEWLHTENPARDPLACFARYLVYTATCEAHSLEQGAGERARAIVEQGEQVLAARRAELAELHRDDVHRLEDAAAQGEQLVDATVRDFVVLADELTQLRAVLDESAARAAL
ncbi:MAG: hypothetical protein ABWY11_26325 [Umezawaea sp.]